MLRVKLPHPQDVAVHNGTTFLNGNNIWEPNGAIIYPVPQFIAIKNLDIKTETHIHPPKHVFSIYKGRHNHGEETLDVMEEAV